jgi:phosphatidylethanolamine N-methyltransferase
LKDARALTVDKPAEVNFTTVRESLKHIVPLCLDSDPSLIPLSCRKPNVDDLSGKDAGVSLTLDSLSNGHQGHPETEDRDPDDFSFWSERQAKRISVAVKQIFDVEYAPEVIVADANLTTLANRILVSKEMLSPSLPGVQ